jgi:hypothetical protein
MENENQDVGKIEKELIDSILNECNGTISTFFGFPVEELNRRELLAAIAFLNKELRSCMGILTDGINA